MMSQEDLQPCFVRSQLYLSSVRTEVYRDILDQHGITHILQVGFELRPTHKRHYTYLQLPLYDMPEQDIVSSFPAAFEFIDKAMAAGGSVLVHCQAGISRSATIVIGYCMWKERLSADAATSLVTAARSVVWPNAGFRCQLREFETLGYDASKWEGWSMSKYLHTQYGEESVGFMASMLGGPPKDRVSLRQQEKQQQMQEALQLAQPSTHSSAAADAGSTAEEDSGDRWHDAAPSRSLVAMQRPLSSSFKKGGSNLQADGGTLQADAALFTSSGDSSRQPCGHDRRFSMVLHASSTDSTRRVRRHSTGHYAAATAAAGVAAVHMGGMRHLSTSSSSYLPEEAALLMAG